jgi:hypothetical protein
MSAKWAAAAALVPISFALVFAGIVQLYRNWSQAPAPQHLQGALVSPEAVVLVSRGGYLTPGSAFFTRDQLIFFAAGRRMVTLPLERVARVEAVRGKLLRTPYLDFFARDGRRLGRLAVESAEAWEALMRELCLSGRG